LVPAEKAIILLPVYNLLCLNLENPLEEIGRDNGFNIQEVSELIKKKFKNNEK